MVSPTVPQSTRKPLEQWPAVIVQRTLLVKSRPVKPTEHFSLPTLVRQSIAPARTPVSQLSRALHTSGSTARPGSSMSFTPAVAAAPVSEARWAGGTATTTRLVSTSMPTWPRAAAPSGPSPPRSASAWRLSWSKLRGTSLVSTRSPSSCPRRSAASAVCCGGRRDVHDVRRRVVPGAAEARLGDRVVERLARRLIRGRGIRGGRRHLRVDGAVGVGGGAKRRAAVGRVGLGRHRGGGENGDGAGQLPAEHSVPFLGLVVRVEGIDPHNSPKVGRLIARGAAR